MTDDGYVPTPRPVTDLAVAKCFVDAPTADDTVLLPGCGTGQFAAAILRYCSYRGHECPELHAVEANEGRVQQFADRFENASEPHQPAVPEECAEQLQCTYPPDWTPSYRDVAADIHLHHDDFLLSTPSTDFDYILSNPPFVKYNSLDPEKREKYSEKYVTAQGRFNLYAPFAERMCDLLAADGQMCFLLPDQFLLSRNDQLRQRLREETIHEVRPLPDAVFPDHGVRTCLLSMSGDPSLGLNGSYAITSWHYTVDVRRLLEGLGVPENRISDQISTYDDRYQGLQETLRARRRQNGKDGGYNVGVDPTIESTTSTQSDLGQYA